MVDATVFYEENNRQPKLNKNTSAIVCAAVNVIAETPTTLI